MGSNQKEKAADEKFCQECGEPIKKAAEICPNCGVRQEGSPSEARSDTSSRSQESVTTDIGPIFAFMDMKDAKRPARHLIDLLLVLSTVGLYLKIILIEWLWHYYNLKKGKYEPFDEERDTRIWGPTLQ